MCIQQSASTVHAQVLTIFREVGGGVMETLNLCSIIHGSLALVSMLAKAKILQLATSFCSKCVKL